MALTVYELLKTPFSQRSNEEKVKIISGEKPRPSLLLKFRNEKGLTDDQFSTSIYDEITWLAACEETQKLFCWPCLLMIPRNEWNSEIVFTEYSIKTIKQHEEEPQHLEAVKIHQLFKENPSALLNPQSNQELVSDDDSKLLKLLIQAICHVIQITNANTNKLNYNRLEINEVINSLILLKQNNFHAENFEMLIKSPEIINRLVDAITVTLKVAIENEIKHSANLSITLTEHVPSRVQSQISTVIRFTKNGEVCERFIGFTNSVGFNLKHKDIADHILKFKKEYNYCGNLLSLSVDGAVLSALELSYLFDLDNFQCKYLVPCYFHEFGRVLIQSVSQLEDCDLFFKILGSLQAHLENEDNFSKFEALLLSQNPQLRKNKLYTSYPILTFVNTYRKNFVDYCNLEQTSPCLSDEDRKKMISIKAFLEKFKTIFLLKVFGKLFSNYLDKNLNFSSDIFNTKFDEELANFKSNAEELLSKGFSKVWISAFKDYTGKNSPNDVKIDAGNDPNKGTFRALFESILKPIIQEIKFRPKDVLSLRFCNLLLDHSENETLIFEERLASLLLYEFPNHFNRRSLNSEINVMNEDTVLLLKNKTVYDIMTTFNNYKLCDTFSQLYMLSELILTLPVMPPTKNFDFSKTKVKEIENFSYMPQENIKQIGETSILCIEKHLLKDLSHLDSFYEDVIKKYKVMKKMGWI